MNSGRWEAGVAECELCFRTLPLDASTINYTAFNCGPFFCEPCVHGTPALSRTCPACGMKLGIWGFVASIMLPIPYDLEIEILAASPSAAHIAMDDATLLEHSSRICNEVLSILDDEGNNYNINNLVVPTIAHATEQSCA